MRQRTRLSVDGLERRDVPATFGIPWPNGEAVTVSFAPDGANVDGSPSQLQALMARSGLSTTLWQTQILRAFEAWAAPADMNVGVVSDDGSPLGAPGNPQADPRFGDIRIFAAPLSTSDLAITTPPGDLAGTRTGDIILNSNYTFGVGPYAAHDLCTVLFQEAGHAFGVPNSPDTTSVMYEYYLGARAGLSAGDLTSIRNLYGARPLHFYEAATGNNSASTATPMAPGAVQVAYGDIAVSSDGDWYSFTAPAGGTTTISLRTSGLSLLAGRVAVYTPYGAGLGMATATLPGQDVSLTLNLVPGAKYYAYVLGSGYAAFAAGQYMLTVAGAVGGPATVTVGGQPPVDDNYSNETFLTATRLGNVATNGGTAYRVFGLLRAADIDVYTVRSPIPGLNQANVLTATVRAFGDLAPQLTVTDVLGLPVNATVTADGKGLYTIVVPNALPAMDYHVAVQSRTGGVGDYDLRVYYRSTVTTSHEVDSGVLLLLKPSVKDTIQVFGSAQIYFQLSTLLTPVIGPGVTVKIYDAYNNLRFQLLADAGDTASGVALLGPGQYRVVIAGVSGLLPNILSTYSLKTALLTDPTGVPPSDPNDPSSGGTTSSPPPSGYNYYNDTGYYTWGERTPTGGSG